jgi:hypothetical protein
LQSRHYTNNRRRRWTRKLRILGKDQEAVFLDESAIGDELLAQGYGVGVTLGRWALLQDGGGVVEYDEAARCALSSRLGSLNPADEYAAGLSFRGGLSDRCENVGAENGKQLSNSRQKNFHVLAVRFGKLGAASLILFEREPADLSGLGEEAAFKISHMCLSQVLVLADKNDGRDPELLSLVLLESLTNDLRLTDVGAGCIGKRVAANEDINAGLFEFLAG